MPKFLVETVELVKRQYVLCADDQIAAQDAVTMKEVPTYDKCSLGETIVCVSPIVTNEENDFYIPNVDPVREAKIAAAKGE
jgi:hypothetical protein